MRARDDLGERFADARAARRAEQLVVVPSDADGVRGTIAHADAGALDGSALDAPSENHVLLGEDDDVLAQ
jgi:hypothetical protein